MPARKLPNMTGNTGQPSPQSECCGVGRRLVSTNVLPEYQRWGVGLVLMSRLVPEIFKWGIEMAEFSWVLESNHLSRATLERGGAEIDKMYRIYDKSLL